MDDVIKRAMNVVAEVESNEVNIDHISKFKDEAIEIASNPFKIHGLSTGLYKLDQLLMGMAKGELIIVAGDTTVGKTLFAQNIIKSAYLSNKNDIFTTLVFTLEMSRPYFISRFYKMYEDPDAWPVLLYDNTKGITIEKIGKAIEQCKAEYGVGLVLIDMVNSLPGTGENITTELSRNSKAVKALAVKHEVPIILTAHTRRRDGNDAKLPSLNDIKDSSSLAQDADMVVLLSRDDQDEAERYKLNCYVAKNRNKGRTGTLPMEINFNDLTIKEA